MNSAKKKTNPVLFILKLPFLFLMYVSLGCYYTLYLLCFPVIIIFKQIGDASYAVYKKRENRKNILKDINLNESVSLKTSETDKEEMRIEIAARKTIDEKIKESLHNSYENIYFVKKAREEDEKKREKLLEELKDTGIRSDKPLTYQYVVRNPEGKKVTNTFYAYSKMEVFTYLENEGNRVISINTSQLITFLYGPTNFGAYRFRNKDLIFWLTQLSTYLKAGIPLTESMRILNKQMSGNPRKKRVFDSIIYNLTLGEAFSKALEKQKTTFPALLINMIKTAEATGELEETLDEMANYYTDIESTRKQMISAITYPAIITVFSITVIVFILLFVIPQFESIYAESGAELNDLTSFILLISKFLKGNLIYLILFIILIGLAIYMLYRKVKSFRHLLQFFAMHLPIYGKIVIYKEMSVFAKTFSSLLKNNVFITESMTLLSDVTNNEIYKNIMYRTVDNIAKGEKISQAFKNHWAVPEVAYYMIVTGESTAELAKMMGKVAEYYQEEHKAIVSSLKAFIEPTMIVMLAVIVGGIVMAVILPMFGLYEQVQ